MFKHDFCEENKKYLMNFLQVANQHKTSRYCDLNEYQKLSKCFPLDRAIKRDFNCYIEKENIVIDITDSDEEENVVKNDYTQQDAYLEETENIDQNINQSVVDDIAFSIKESLETRKCISNSILNNLSESNVYQEDIFSSLAQELNFDEILNFGVSLKSSSVANDIIISFFVEYLLLKQLNLEFSNRLQDVLNEFSVKYSEILIEKLVKTLLATQSCSKIFLQYLDGLSLKFKALMFRKIVFTCENFQESYIGVLEILLSPQVEYDSLNKLIDILSNSTDTFSSDKSFGKLLINVIKLLGKNVSQLEQPLKHIIGSHTSIWKSKIQKTFNDCLQDSFIMTQSFR